MNILITQNHLSDLAGSEIVTYELCEYFASSGHSITVATNHYDNPIKKHFDKLKNVKIIKTTDNININKYDLLWIHHSIIPTQLLDGSFKETPPIVFNHLSPYEPFELSRYPEIENEFASLIIANSPETKEALVKAGISKEIVIMSNAAPDSFYNDENPSSELKRLLIVTNHCPPELKEALEIIEKKGVNVQKIGVSFDNMTKVTPPLIRNSDAIITIGKTVQYSILSNRPVYIYDHMQGPGYLTLKNFDNAKKHNFSGRGFKNTKKSGEQIAHDLIHKYDFARHNIKEIHDIYSKDYLLSEVLSIMLKKINYKPTKITAAEGLCQSTKASIELLNRETQSKYHYKNNQDIYIDSYNKAMLAVNSYQEKIKELNIIIERQNNLLHRFPVYQIIKVGKIILRKR